MTDRRLHCREHGGYFMVPAKRGRPPVKCSEANPCDAVKLPGSKLVRKQRQALAAEYKALTTTEAHATARQEVRRGRQAVGNAAMHTAALAKAKAMRDQLEEVGWTVAGKGFKDAEGQSIISVTAARGAELIDARWVDGVLQPMHYSLWSTEKPSANGKPPSNLPFDPSEVPDRELVRLISGTKVTWYNRLGQNTETAVCSPNTIRIDHIYDGHGDERPEDRLMHFVDASQREGERVAGGTRTFRLDALLKIGK